MFISQERQIKTIYIAKYKFNKYGVLLVPFSSFTS